MQNNDPAIVLDDPDLDFFGRQGMHSLMISMFKQSIQDVFFLKKHPTETPMDIEASANWLDTPSGHDCIAYLIPDANPRKVVARIRLDPEGILDSLKGDELPSAGSAVSCFAVIDEVASEVLMAGFAQLDAAELDGGGEELQDNVFQQI